MFKVNEKEDTVLVHFEQISHIVVVTIVDFEQVKTKSW